MGHAAIVGIGKGLSTPCRALHTYIGLTTADSTGGASGCAGQGVVNRARRRSRPRGFHPFCNPTSPVKHGPFFDPYPDIRRLLRSRPSRQLNGGPVTGLKRPWSALARLRRRCAAHCFVPSGVQGLVLVPQQEQNRSPQSSLADSPPDWAVPSDFLLAPPHPVSPTGRGSCADFRRTPTNRRITSDGRNRCREQRDRVCAAVQAEKVAKNVRRIRTPRPRLSRLRQASARSAWFSRAIEPEIGPRDKPSGHYLVTGRDAGLRSCSA